MDEVREEIEELKRSLERFSSEFEARIERLDDESRRTVLSNLTSFLTPVRVLANISPQEGGKAGLFLGSGPLGLYYGTGLPTVSASQGSLYVRTDASGTASRLYINTDSGNTWTNFTTAA